MICPLIALADSIIKTPTTLVSACIEDTCAWWDDARLGCAVQLLGAELFDIAQAVREASGHIPPIE